MYFKFKGLSSEYMGVTVMALPPRVQPVRRYTDHIIPGRDGTVRTWDGAYESILLPIGIYVPRQYGFGEPDKLIEIEEWLDGRGWLELSDRVCVKYDATAALETRLDYWVDGFEPLVGTVTFKVEPYAYHVNEMKYKFTESGGECWNGGRVESEPVIAVYGSGRFNLTVGETALEFRDVPAATETGKPSIIIDSTLCDCYSAAGANLNRCMTGEFPALPPRQRSTIEWTIPTGATGEVTAAEVTVNPRDRFC